MAMTVQDAKEECERYLAHLAREEEKTLALQRLASDRRRGLCDDHEKDSRMREIMGPGPTVYDGARLADAVRTLLAEI